MYALNIGCPQFFGRQMNATGYLAEQIIHIPRELPLLETVFAISLTGKEILI
jgi:hypothetical protein